MTAPHHAARAGRREWLGLAALGLPTFLVSMDFSVLYLAVPHLTADLAPSGMQQLWIVDIYGFLIAGFLVTMGTVGDRIGRKRLLLIGSAVFGLASICAAFSTTPEMLIASRAVLGVAGAAVMPSVLALVTVMFTDERQRGRALAIYLTCFMGGATLGPIVGGVLLEYFWWGSVFLVAVPGVVVLILLGPALLPDQRGTPPAPIDPVSVALSLTAMLPFVYGLKDLPRHGASTWSVGMVVVGVSVMVLFVRRQRRLDQPLLDLSLFGDRTFTSALALMFSTSVVGTGTLLLVTLYLQNVAGLSPLSAGALLVVPNILLMVGLLAAPRLTTRIPAAHLIAVGLVVAAVGYAGFALAGATSGPGRIVVAMSIVMLGTGPLAALCNHLAMGAVPAANAGSGASIVQTTNELGLGLGIATLATLGTAIYRSDVEGSLDGVPGGVAQASRESVDRAVVAAAELPSGQAHDLIDSAREAFTTGVHVVGAVSATLYAVLAMLALWAFHRTGTSSGSEPTGPDGFDEPAESTTEAHSATNPHIHDQGE